MIAEISAAVRAAFGEYEVCGSSCLACSLPTVRQSPKCSEHYQRLLTRPHP